MELYIPPPSFFPRMLPPKPVVPAVPIVPLPDLPEVLHAPEGAYHLNPDLLPFIGNPAHPTALDVQKQNAASNAFLGGAAGFMAPPGGPGQAVPTGATAMSFGSTIVNGQSQPAWPVKMSFVNVWFAPKAVGGERGGFGNLLGGGKGNSGARGGDGSGGPDYSQPPPMTGYEPSISSDSSSPPLSDVFSPPMEFPMSPVPQQGGSKRMPFGKGQNSNNSNTNALPRPKNNLRSSNSTFVTRLQALDNLPKVLAEKARSGTGEFIRWGFWNLGRTFAWGEEGGKVKEPLARVTFSQISTCHAVSTYTVSPERVDIIVGFASGDLVWLDFVLGKYTRLNKSGVLNNTAVLGVHFDPRQPHHFIAHFADSTILRFNLFAEDPANLSTAQVKPWETYLKDEQARLSASTSRVAINSSTAGSTKNGSSEAGDSEISDELIRWKNEDWALLSPENARSKDKVTSIWAGKNPIAAVKIGKSKVNSMTYSPDGRFLAVVSEDGCLRLVDVAEEQVTDTFAGYFGSLTCIAWSPDSRFVAVGGQDDLITIFSPRESRIVARCQGHSAFVTCISFDQSRGESRAYRFASVGEDGKLILWDFSAAALQRPRHHHSNSSHHRINGAGSTLSLPGHSRSHLPLDGKTSNFHPAPPRSEVALLQPVMARIVEGTIITGVYMLPHAVITMSRAAVCKIWQKPPKSGNTHRPKGAGNGGGAGGREGGRERRERERDRE
ncbi:hypothetical protein CI109_103212 [Kwoniella shandongensis]|uniref:Uncharacterized protein n=1 Tax=Kwoniella shandongensis TaxID=1734106 RepID=A0A5M6CEM8_9TREE|nr:uncharacterized protein CI109_000402 [Kwoniella shandongensis]KAA5531559.1 hypothetical protein CI109_000402 [Kwoniella shandongensis]